MGQGKEKAAKTCVSVQAADSLAHWQDEAGAPARFTWTSPRRMGCDALEFLSGYYKMCSGDNVVLKTRREDTGPRNAGLPQAAPLRGSLSSPSPGSGRHAGVEQYTAVCLCCQQFQRARSSTKV